MTVAKDCGRAKRIRDPFLPDKKFTLPSVMVQMENGNYTIGMENGIGTKAIIFLAAAALIVFGALGVLLGVVNRVAPPGTAALGAPKGLAPAGTTATGTESATLTQPGGGGVLSAAPVSISSLMERRQAMIAPPAGPVAPVAVNPAPKPAAPEMAPDAELMEGMTKGNVAEITDAVRRGANVNPTDLSQGTPLLWAVVSGEYSLMEQVLQRGANVNTTIGAGETALMAAPSQKTIFVRRLLEAGADANIRTHDDDTALIAACRAANAEAATMLLQAGADPRVKNKRGDTALGLATAGNLTNLVMQLNQAGATE